MKKILFAYQQSSRNTFVLLLIAIAAFLLQSCCFLGPVGFASQKPCRCKPADSSYAAHQTSAGQSGMPLLANTVVNGDADLQHSTILLNEHTIGAIPIVDRRVISEPIPADISGEPLNVYTNPNALPASRQILYATPENKSNKKFAEKKMPLGIKAIKTSVTAGPNLSFKSSKEDYGGTQHKSKPGVGFQFGFSTSYYFSEKFAVAPALLFKNNNASETISYGSTNEPPYGGGASQEYETRYSYSYLSVPILAEFHINEQLTLMAGPEVNLLMSANTKQKSGGNSEKTDIKSSSVKTGVGAQVGVKYVIPNTPVGIQLLYDHRISRLNEKSPDDYPGGSYETPAWNMKSIQLGVTCAICDLLHGGKK